MDQKDNLVLDIPKSGFGRSFSRVSHDEHVQELSWRRLYLAKARLKQASNTSALLAGFAMVAMVEASLDENLPQALLIIFSISTTLVVVVHLLALMISTCILPDIEAIGHTDNKSDVKHSPHDHVRHFVEIAWIFSTGFGLSLFLIQIGVIAWLRFYLISIPAAIASMVVLVPGILIFTCFAMRFYRRIMKLKYRRSKREIGRVEAMAQELEAINTAAPVIYVENES